MTTVATDGYSVAADTKVTTQNAYMGRVLKIFRVGKEIVGCSGEGDSCQAYIQWLLSEDPEEDVPDIDWDSFNALHVSKKGAFLICGKQLIKHKVVLPFAIGTGSDYAIGAMLAGADPARAVRLAAKRDLKTNAKVTVLNVE